MNAIIPHLWFDDQAEAAAELYANTFPDGRVIETTRYPQAAQEVSGKPPGSVMTVEVELRGQRLILLNGGPDFKLSEAFSLLVECEDQEEIDYFWSKLGEGGEEGPCGWVKDRFGLSWQIAPRRLSEMMRDSDQRRVEAVTAVFMQMSKLDLQQLEDAFQKAA